jgi:hypothetical protein
VQEHASREAEVRHLVINVNKEKERLQARIREQAAALQQVATQVCNYTKNVYNLYGPYHSTKKTAV